MEEESETEWGGERRRIDPEARMPSYPNMKPKETRLRSCMTRDKIHAVQAGQGRRSAREEEKMCFIVRIVNCLYRATSLDPFLPFIIRESLWSPDSATQSVSI